jgi:hypothetical protein
LVQCSICFTRCGVSVCICPMLLSSKCLEIIRVQQHRYSENAILFNTLYRLARRSTAQVKLRSMLTFILLRQKDGQG